MIYTFTLFSLEHEDFTLEIKADAGNTFLQLQEAILQACGYADSGKHRFLICDEDWNVEKQVRQTDAGTYSDEDLLLMDEVPLEDLLEDEGQHLAYIYAPEHKKIFTLELSRIEYGQHIDMPHVSRKHGVAPAQYLEDTEDAPAPAKVSKPEEEDNAFYGDEGFEEGELDAEGFDIVE